MKFLRALLPLAILGLGVFIVYGLVSTKPEAQTREPPKFVIPVEATRLEPTDYTVTLSTQGSVRARTTSTLIPELSGEIVRVSDSFREGGFFAPGEVLLEIDPSDYETALVVAESNLADAQLRLAEEEAQAKQARLDWERLGRGEDPTALVLRQPQLARERASVAAAEARVAEAKRNLERTKITAPYEGRVLTQNVDVGQVVSPGTVLAQVFATDYAEVRLPLTANEYGFLDLPDNRSEANGSSLKIPVTLSARFGARQATWQAEIVRVESAIDTRSRQLFVVAQVDDPYGTQHEEPLKVGLFVEAEIEGITLPHVYVLPRTALRESRYALTINDENRLLRVEVDALWSNQQEVVFQQSAIAPGTVVSLTQISVAVDGMEVSPQLPGETPSLAGEGRPGGRKPRPDVEGAKKTPPAAG